MLEAKKTTTTKVVVNITGTSTIDGDTVARYNAHFDPDDRPVVVTTIIDREKFEQYGEAVQEDEQAFEEYVCDAGKVAMTTQDEVDAVLTSDVPAGGEEEIIQEDASHADD